MPVVAGVDSSTQSCQVEPRDLRDGSLLASGSAPHPPAFPPSGEQDPAAWWTALRAAALMAARNDAGGSPDGIGAVAVDGQCHGMVALDTTDQVLIPAKPWHDITSAPQLERLKGLTGAPDWIRAVGSPPTAAFTLGKLAWLAENEPAHYRRPRPVLLPHHWPIRKLSGRYATDRSEASGTGCHSAARSRYLPEILAHVDAERDRTDALPKVMNASAAVGTPTATARAELGPPAATLVEPGGGDQHAAALRLGAAPGDVDHTFGTCGVVLSPSDTLGSDPHGTVDGVADMTDGHRPLVSTLDAARVTDTFARILGVDRQALAEPALVACLDGERKPNRPGAQGIHAGLTSTTSRADSAWAALEGVILGLLPGERHLNTAGVATGGRLIATGGEVLVADAPESSARGACVQAAAIASGRPVRDIRGEWAPTTRSAAAPQPGSAHARERAYTVLADRDPLDTDGAGHAGPTT
ncbi:FGGY family carbohydrate kinase [Streptomyces sp. NPDC056716]|uniref:FGGY family carbohydrate kinase n=1 Tax=unclassified Streptomyces TaxID=2593676 RepID=UPI003699A939